MSGCICGYAQEFLRLHARANVPTHKRKKRPPSRGKFYALTREVKFALQGEHLCPQLGAWLFSWLGKYFSPVREKLNRSYLQHLQFTPQKLPTPIPSIFKNPADSSIKKGCLSILFSQKDRQPYLCSRKNNVNQITIKKGFRI